MSVKDRWVGPREQVLNVPITYWYMGPVSLVAGCQRKVGFAPTASMVVLGEKLNTDLRIGQPLCCELGREPFFLGAVTLLNSVND
jgi:hypothetical protein